MTNSYTRKRCIGVFLWIAALTLCGKVSAAATLRVPSQYGTVQAAAAAANNGDTIEIAAGTYTGGDIVVTWTADNLIIRGVGGKAHMNASGTTISNGKAIWVISGENTRVENIEFSGAAVNDHNGAGIRQEGKHLTVSKCSFHDNENGILVSDISGTDSEILVEYSEFARNGYGDGYTHNMYINHVGKFTLQYCYTHHTKIGHNVKSRAYENHILYNRIMDETSGTASYQVDLPNGGRSYLIGNILHQGANADNNRLVSYAAEGGSNPVQELYVSGNTFVNDRSAGGTAIGISGTPSGKIVNNLFDNCSTLIEGSFGGSVSNNIDSANMHFADRAGFDYHLTGNSPGINSATNPGSANGVSLTPVNEYLHPTQRTSRANDGQLDIGAFEYGGNVSFLLWTQ